MYKFVNTSPKNNIINNTDFQTLRKDDINLVQNNLLVSWTIVQREEKSWGKIIL